MKGQKMSVDFNEWHQKQLNGDLDKCPHKAWERKAWYDAVIITREICAKICLDYANRLAKISPHDHPTAEEAARACADEIINSFNLR